jgi:hypothetical protein
MNPGNENDPHEGGRLGGLAAKQVTRREFSPSDPDHATFQLRLFDDEEYRVKPAEPDYPPDGMYPPRAWATAEWDLRLTVNRLAYEREPRHWWIRDRDRRSDGAA